MSERALRIAILMGGRSAEREVSLHTGEQVSRALASIGHEVVHVDTADIGFIETLRTGRFDLAFICLHGRFGEDGTIQGLLELLELPYVGSGVLASALAMDKVVSKQIFVAAGIPTPAWAVVRRGHPYSVEEMVGRLGGKLVVKPVSEGSSVGMSIVHEPAELAPAIERAFEHDRTVLIEEFVAGAEVTVGVLGNSELTALPTLEVVPEHEFYDYESKYVPGMSRHIIPARVPDVAREECQRIALEAHRALTCRGMSRADTIVTADGTVYLLEVNTIPGMTKTSLLPDAARAAGIEFPELCGTLVSFARER
ncbi:MAG: D-alanine--D-alanine ligase [Coriobacteriia bacterium]|nr:D-alanine--D-alanine ligase [Coriobacteriia bacterium]MBN2841064.1 D-alanine--D-alanine ligase [Coriobacteriia bacterium]